MIPSKTILSCALCTKIIIENENLDKTLSQLALENNVAQLRVIKSSIKEYGYLCEDCFKLLSKASPIKKQIKKAFKLGNSCGILVPRKWLNRKVVAFLQED